MAAPDDAIVKLSLANPPNQYAIVKSSWGTEMVQLTVLLLDESLSSVVQAEYFGTATFESMTQIAEALDLPRDTVIKVSKEALSAIKSNEEFIYKLEDGKFKWCKINENGCWLQYGCVRLQESAGASVNLLLYSLNAKEKLQEKYEETHRALEESQIHHAKMKRANEEFVAAKSKERRQDLTKFVALLNEKKAKIGKLESELKTLRESQKDWLFSQENGNNFAMVCDQNENLQKCDSDETNLRLPTRSLRRSHTKEALQSNFDAPIPSTSAHPVPEINAVDVYEQDTQQIEIDQEQDTQDFLSNM